MSEGTNYYRPKPKPGHPNARLPPLTDHRKHAVIIKASGAKLVAMHAV